MTGETSLAEQIAELLRGRSLVTVRGYQEEPAEGMQWVEMDRGHARTSVYEPVLEELNAAATKVTMQERSGTVRVWFHEVEVGLDGPTFV